MSEETPKVVPEHVARLTRGGFDRQQGGDLFLSRGPHLAPVAYHGDSEPNLAWLAGAKRRAGSGAGVGAAARRQRGGAQDLLRTIYVP